MTNTLPMPFINIHTHSTTVAKNELAVVNILAAELEHKTLKDDLSYSIGLHPWHIQQDTCIDNIERIMKHAKLKQVLAIGEIGLDKTIQVPLDLQIKCLIEQIVIANAVKKPIIIHCVKAFNEILQLKQQIDNTTPWIIHGFKGKEILMLKLIESGCYISFGTDLYKAESNSKENIRFVSDKQIFFETDIAEEKIENIYKIAAHLRQQNISTLKQAVENNFNSIFKL